MWIAADAVIEKKEGNGSLGMGLSSESCGLRGGGELAGEQSLTPGAMSRLIGSSPKGRREEMRAN